MNDEASRDGLPTELPNMPDATSLSDRKSTRTTFNLTREANELLERLSKCSSLPEKDIIDLYVDLMFSDPRYHALVDLAGKIPSGDRRRRTRVITRGASRKLRAICEKHEISRDDLLEAIILFAGIVTSSHLKADVARLQEARERFNKLREVAEESMSKIDELMGDAELPISVLAVFDENDVFDDLIQEKKAQFKLLTDVLPKARSEGASAEAETKQDE